MFFLLGFLIGVIVGTLTLAAFAVESEKESVRRGIVELNKEYYVLGPRMRKTPNRE